jgi:hypothetical protein
MDISVLYIFGSFGAGYWLDVSHEERESFRSDMI